ncbi:type 2 lanthipeptide synthetase LanM [Halorussus litoreus]|uniref:type 2 lanthipeptide synthetase LanM n=1 Tax=Halorussus litoreus TaxID=1710536 RepID=UPI000E2256F4|nr:type 2 lanthipeptide synthetase LanM [Halorussus litoreus]
MSDASIADDRKRRIAGRARTLRERLDDPANSGPAVEEPGEWLAEWRDRVADGDPAAFRRRLDHLGVSEDEARAAVSTHGWPADEPLPEWVDELESVGAAVVAADRGASSPDALDVVPFVDLLAPVVDHARERVDPSVAPAEMPAVVDAAEPWLYRRLSELTAHPLFVEFKSYVAHHDHELAFADDPDPPEDDRRYYREFADAMLGEGFVRFVEEYALLARLLVATIRQWVAAVEEFAGRLAADRVALRDWSGDGDLGAVEAIDAAGDRHDDGRAVLAVTFESGVRVAYKPRPLDVEAGFYDLLDWLAERTELPAVDRPAVLNRGEYGWLEWVESEPCADRDAADRYYHRAGVLLGVLYALRFIDGHLENLIAAGEHPVVVDLETLAYPGFPDDRLPRSDSPAVMESVLRTGLLPTHEPDSDWADLSGFGAEELPGEGERRTFTAVGTDLMEMESVERDPETFENLPRVDGETIPAEECFEALRDGLQSAHDAVAGTREALLAEDGPLAAFGDSEVRVLYRATRTYSTILSSLTTPEYLRTGLKVGCKFEALARPQTTGDVDAPGSVHDHETAALKRLDVPRLSMSTTGTALGGPADSIPEFAALSPRESVEKQLRALDASDRREQCRYAELAFGESGSGDEHGDDEHGDHEDRANPEDRADPEDRSDHADATAGRTVGDPEPLSDDAAERAALDAFDRVTAAAEFDHGSAAADDGDDGPPAWYVPSSRGEGGILLQWIDESLYSGRLGVAVFAAGIAATADGMVADDAAALAADAAAGVRESVMDGDASNGAGGAHDGIGVTGAGGLVYGFTVLDDLLGADRLADTDHCPDADYLADARRLAATITDERVAADDNYAVLDGAAGAVLGLVALHERTGDADVLDRAVACGEHLLDGRSGGRWPLGFEDQPLTGVAHGAAGIGYALARLAAATGEGRFREAAHDAVAFEDDHYDPAAGEWADLRARADGTVDGWCNGRTGIGLARLGTLTALPDDAVHRDVERALSEAPVDWLPPHDHACCGGASWIELFLQAGRQLDAPEYEQRARRIAGRVVAGTDEGWWALKAGTPTRPDPTLFRGLGGVGYALLRVANPELPSLLLFE